MDISAQKKAIQTIVDISRLVTTSRDFFEIKDQVIDRMLEVIPASKACVNIFKKFDHKMAYLVCHNTLEYIPRILQDNATHMGFEIAFDTYPSYIQEAVETKSTIYIPSLAQDPRAASELEMAKMEGYVGRGVFPIISNQFVTGFLTCFLEEGEILEQEDILFIESVTALLGSSMEMTRRNGELDRIISSLRDSINSISNATDQLYINKDLESFLSMMSEHACKITRSQASFILLNDEESRLNIIARFGDFDEFHRVIQFALISQTKNPRERFFTSKNLPIELQEMGVNSLVFENLVKAGEEIGILIVINSQKYSRDDMKILSVYSSQIILAITMYLDGRKLYESQLMERDLEVISKQQDLIMSENHIHLSEKASVDYVYLPSKQIGGDYCKIVRLDDTKVMIFVADVMGHGVLSNFFVAMMKGILRTLLYENLWPNEILNKLNSILFEDLDTLNLFITARMVMMDFENNIAVSANAGHHHPIILSRGEGDTLEQSFFDVESGLPIGVQAESEYEQHIYDISNLQMAAFYTDGIIEASDKYFKEFGTEGLIDYLNQHKEESGREICDQIQDTLYSYTQTKNLDDDVMLIVVKSLNSEGI